VPTLDPIADRPDWGWPDPDAAGQHLNFGLERETDMSGDGSGDPDVYRITIATPDGEEIATLCHRASKDQPIDGEVAVLKQLWAVWICRALDAFDQPMPTIEEARAASLAERADRAELEVSVTVTAKVAVPADSVPEYLSKKLSRWPDELLEATKAGWSAATGIDQAHYDAGDVEITDLRQGPHEDPSTW